jgi:hypothetical protein
MTPEPLQDILGRPAPEAVDGFMERWHVPMDDSPGQLEAPEFFPEVLRRFYARYGAPASAFLVNRLLPPAEVGEDDGFVVFYVEEQAVYLWAIATEDLELEDPPVWCRENEPGKPWVQDAPNVSVFLVQMLVMSAALNGPHGAAAAWLSPDETERVLAPLRQLDLPPWHWPGHPARWYAGDDTVAFTCPNHAPGDTDDPHLSVWVSSLTVDGVRFIEPCLSDAWDYYSPRDG